jgi:hypothetical protein
VPVLYFLLAAAFFFRRSAQRFFIISEIRLLPFALRCLCFGRWLAGSRIALAAPFLESPSSAVMALSIRVLSAFSSETISAIVKFSSL